MPPLDRVTLLAVGLLLPALPACVTTPQAAVGRGRSAPAVGPVLPAIQVARTTQSQSDEPPLAADIIVAGPASANDLVITTKAEEPDESATEPWTMDLRHPEPVLVEAVKCYLNKS